MISSAIHIHHCHFDLSLLIVNGVKLKCCFEHGDISLKIMYQIPAIGILLLLKWIYEARAHITLL